MLLMLWTMLLAPLAHAEQGPYMWGVGPTLNAVVWPSHPLDFPKAAEEEGFKQTGLPVGFGVHAVMYMRATQRFGTHLWYSGGSNGYSSPNITFEYDFVGSSANNVSVLAGLGGGFGFQRWKNDNEDKFKMNTFILRGQGSVNFKTKRNCYEMGLFANFLLPSGSRVEMADGTEKEAGFSIYPTLGLEFTAYFGDFTPPRKGRKGRKGRRKKRGGRR